MENLPVEKEFRVCEICGVMDFKSNMWNMNYGYYLCDDCYLGYEVLE